LLYIKLVSLSGSHTTCVTLFFFSSFINEFGVKKDPCILFTELENNLKFF